MDNRETFRQRLWIVGKVIIIMMASVVMMLGLGFLISNYQTNITHFFHMKLVIWTMITISTIALVVFFINLILTILRGLYELIKWLIEPLKKENK